MQCWDCGHVHIREKCHPVECGCPMFVPEPEETR